MRGINERKHGKDFTLITDEYLLLPALPVSLPPLPRLMPFSLSPSESPDSLFRQMSNDQDSLSALSSLS